MKRKYTEHVIVVVVVLGLIIIVAGLYGWLGLYDIGADVHHWPATYDALLVVRNRSIHQHAKDLKVPDLEDPQLILRGAGQYAAMCTGCHLAPGVNDSELRAGLYPRPPNLSRTRVDPREAFWVIKHGIKMSGMPAWGETHDDATIWSMVAFIERLPGMTPQQYKAIVAKAPPDEDMDMNMKNGADHGHD